MIIQSSRKEQTKKKQHNKLLLTESRTGDKIEKSQMTNQENTLQIKVLTRFRCDDTIRKSLEGDRRKWSLKIEQINIKLSNNQQFFLRVSE